MNDLNLKLNDEEVNLITYALRRLRSQTGFENIRFSSDELVHKVERQIFNQLYLKPNAEKTGYEG